MIYIVFSISLIFFRTQNPTGSPVFWKLKTRIAVSELEDFSSLAQVLMMVLNQANTQYCSAEEKRVSDLSLSTLLLVMTSMTKASHYSDCMGRVGRMDV